jgi:hypothetical protein
VTAEQGLDIGAPTGADRVELGDDLAPADDSKALASVLDRVEEVGEVPRGVGRAHLRHAIRLSDRAPGSTG